MSGTANEPGNKDASFITTRLARIDDAMRIAGIYNQGILDRTATFETEERTLSDIERWFCGSKTVVVAELNGDIIAFATASPYSNRECYSGIAEFSVYVDRGSRGKGAGKAAMRRLVEECSRAGTWKLVSRVFPQNAASRTLLSRIGFREVGVYRKHAKLDGQWRDVIIVELLIEENMS